ncbi:DUF4892 domain-containing protein [Pseudomonas sp. LRF_L74]|uniref:DUF4892 domain-containing protein n=1 Tax=Pseudomonas sp. LRF_L74 TaxID=3369422 RepID=UPI003F624EDE
MRSFVFYSLLALAVSAFAESSGSLDALPAPERSTLSDSREVPNLERRYPQSSIQRISGQVRMDASVLVAGHLRALTYRLAEEHSPVDVAHAARKRLQEQGAQLLYWCEGRDCGASNLWANAVFDNATLYGPEERQVYLLLRLAPPNQDSLLALYGITRGNRRSYLHAEQLDAKAPLTDVLPTAATLLRQLRDEGELALPHLPAQPEARWVELLAKVFSLDSTLRVSLSGNAASAWRSALLEQNLRDNRLQLGEGDAAGLVLIRR